MKKIDSFINKYPVTKTLRFSLLPVGKTLENFEKAGLLAIDEKRAEDVPIVKGIIDRYHKECIEGVLSEIKIDIGKYAEIYFKDGNQDKDLKIEAGR